ncbi:Vitelline membrane outer layer protein 1 [Chelonia mydas]|uniref:Vitelline membrane outer layer protein 1 n=1 Tax=Chelonia mydas TaxID=8469 RepID=M7BUP8_CHEMY|nr:Vitelline membrane outer layer protein 1 [Chelonia mydas]
MRAADSQPRAAEGWRESSFPCGPYPADPFSPPRWGFWTPLMKCQSGQRLTQFRLRVEPCQGLKDDTAADNIEFVCTDGVELKGHGRCWGKWGPQSRSCGQRGICTIATKVEAPQGKGDDTALNDVYFKC